MNVCYYLSTLAQIHVVFSSEKGSQSKDICLENSLDWRTIARHSLAFNILEIVTSCTIDK